VEGTNGNSMSEACPGAYIAIANGTILLTLGYSKSTSGTFKGTKHCARITDTKHFQPKYVGK
jgi:glycine betaine/choline ABC-type transport system substrate-binding protein